MASAAATATTTDIAMLGRSEVSMDWPPSEMRTSGPSADSAALIRCCASAVVTLADGLSQVTRAKAMVPDRLICAAPFFAYGLATFSMPGTLATLPSAAVTADRTGADLIVVPCAAWITTWSPSPEAAGKFCVSKVAAACESVPGRLRFELKLLPTTALTPAIATIASSQTVTTLLRCSKHQRPNRAMGTSLGECAGTSAAPRTQWFPPGRLTSWACRLDLPPPRWCTGGACEDPVTPAGVPGDHPSGV